MASGKEYQMMFQLSAATSAQFQATFNGAQNRIQQLQTRIDALNRTQGDINAYQKQQAAVEKNQAKLQLLTQQYENLKREMVETGDTSAQFKNRLLEKEHQINRTKDALGQQTQKLDEMGRALTTAGVDTQNLTGASQQLQGEMDSLRDAQMKAADSAEEYGQSLGDAMTAMQSALVAAGVVEGLKAIGDALKDCTDASIQYESAMAAVKRTVGGSDGFIQQMGADFRALSTTIPITAEEMAGIAATAGQLGIAQQNVEGFTLVMAQLATTTDLSADSAATMLAQFANITGTQEYDRLGSTVARLGDSTATTASKVVEMSQGMAASATQAGMAETDILAIAAAVGSLGIEAAAGSTSMSTLISTLYKATETGDKLEEYASVAGMSASEFKRAWGEDAVGAMNAFIQGLNDTERNGKSAVVILDELGINNVRQTKAILGLASAGDLLSNTIAQANEAWEENTALSEKAGVMYSTTEARLTMAQNAANNVKVAIGDALTPALAELADVATAILQPVAEWIAANPEVVQGLVATAGVIAGVTAAVLAVGAAMKVGAAAAALFTAAIPGLPLILGITAGVAALAGGIVYLSGTLGEAGESFEELDQNYDDLTERIAREQHVIELCQEYQQLSDEIQGVQDKAGNLSGEGKVRVTAEAEADLTPGDFMDPNGLPADVEGEAEQTVKPWMFMDPKGEPVKLSAVQEQILEAYGFMKDPNDDTIYLKGEPKYYLTPKGFMDSETGDIIKLTPEQASYLAAQGFLDENGNVVMIQGTPDAQKLLGGDKFVDGTPAEITGTALQQLAGGQFVKDENAFIKGAPDSNSLLTASDFVPDTTILIKPAVGDTSALTDLEARIQSVGDKLDYETRALSAFQTEYEHVEGRLMTESDPNQRMALQNALDGLTTTIENQQEKVQALQTQYDGLLGEYASAKEAYQGLADAEQGSVLSAEELAEKEARLAEIKQELIAASGGLISETTLETLALEDQVAVLEALARARQDEYRAAAYESLTKQSKEYVRAIRDEEEYSQRLEEVSKEQAWAYEVAANGIEGLQSQLYQAYGDLQTYAEGVDFDWEDEGVQERVREIEKIMSLMTGQDVKLNGFNGLIGVISGMEASYSGVESRILAINDQVIAYAEAVDNADETQRVFLDNLVAGVLQGGMSMEELERLLSEQFANVADGEAIVADAMEYVRGKIEATADASGEMADGMDQAQASALDLQNAISPITEEMEALAKAYDEAYESAVKSAEGQFKLFEAVEKIAAGEQSSGDMTAALQSQAAYWEEYTQLLQRAKELGLDEGLLSGLADGSEESAAALKTLSQASDEEIQALNDSYSKAEAAREQFAGTAAEIETNFTEEMAKLQEQMATTISEMELSDEAAESARATFDAMISKADEMKASVAAAYQRVVDAARRVLNVTLPAPKIGTPGSVDQGYASGVLSAPPGLAWVGEEGPELMAFAGGERVFNARESAALVSDGGSSGGVVLNFAPVYNLSGASDTAEVRAVLDAHDDEMRARLEEMLEEIEADRGRRAYV